MNVLSQARLDMVRAFFCDEFDTEVLTPFHIEDASADVIAEFTTALQSSGLLLATEVDAITRSWNSEPAKLFVLLGQNSDRAVSAVSSINTPEYRKAS